jgi:hypothetical protein
MGLPARSRDVGGMSGVRTGEPGACPSCRGQGWKFRRARRALVIGTLTRGAADPSRRSCLDCGGSGRTGQAA